MNIFKVFLHALRNGFRVFSTAAHGEYRELSPEIKEMYNDVYSNVPGAVKDKKHLREDRAKVKKYLHGK